MMYILKFGAAWVLPPGIFFIILWYIAYKVYRRRQKKLAAGLAVVTLAFYLLSTGLVCEQLMGSLEQENPVPAKPDGDVIIMLGGGALAGTRDVDGEGTICSIPANRLLTAVRLQRQLQVPIIVSGGQVYEDSATEAVLAKRILISLGVPEKDILVEDASLNTVQNALFSAAIMREKRLKEPILVTSAFHMSRSVACFEKAGYRVVPYPCDFQTSPNPIFHYNKLCPDASSLENNVIVLREKLRLLVTKVSSH